MDDTTRQLDGAMSDLGRPPVFDAYEFLYDWLPEDSEPGDVPQAVYAAADEFNRQVAALARLEETEDE